MIILIVAADPVAGPPGADQEVERDQHQVEEEDEEEQVLGEEGAQRPGLREAEHEEVVARPVRALQRRPADRRGPEQRGQEDEEDAEPVDAELEADPELRDPALVDDLLKGAARRIEVDQQGDRQPERDEAAEQRPPADQPGHAAREEEAEEPDRDREEDGSGRGSSGGHQEVEGEPGEPTDHEQGVEADEARLGGPDDLAEAADRRRWSPVTMPWITNRSKVLLANRPMATTGR